MPHSVELRPDVAYCPSGRSGFRDAGLEVVGDWIRFCEGNVEYAKRAALSILKGEHRPTAILATNEEMTLGVAGAANELGLSIGFDLSLIGFDDAPWAQVFNPPISVIKRPVEELGAVAVKLLLRKIDDLTVRDSHILHARLITRRSVGIPPLM